MKSKLIKFVIFCNRIMGESVPAKDFIDLESRMLKRQKEFWSHIEYKDEQNRTVKIIREWLDAGMSLEDVISDWLDNATEQELNDEILIGR